MEAGKCLVIRPFQGAGRRKASASFCCFLKEPTCQGIEATKCAAASRVTDKLNQSHELKTISPVMVSLVTNRICCSANPKV